MARFLNMRIVKYLFLVISAAFFALSINYFVHNVQKPKIDPFYNIYAARIEGVDKFLLEVKQETQLHLLLKAVIGEGYTEFKLAGDDGRIVFEYRTDGDDFIKEVIVLDEGSYLCTINREAIDYKEILRLYFDKSHVTRVPLGRDYKTVKSNVQYRNY